MGYLNPALNNPALVNFYRVQLNKDLINFNTDYLSYSLP